MTHPSEAELALHAGGDLGWWKRRLTERHLRRCGPCQESVSDYSGIRAARRGLPDLPVFPGTSWPRLESEMTANIRLGLSAGECVSMRAGRLTPLWQSAPGMFLAGLGRVPRPVTWRRLGLAGITLLGLAGISYIVEHPPSSLGPGLFAGANSARAGRLGIAAVSFLESSETGLQVHDGGQTLRLLNPSARGTSVSRSVGARGELGARYVDPNGYVTISQIYGQ